MRYGLILMTLFFMAFQVSGQEKAEKIDEFGSVTCDDYLARADNFFVMLNNNPSAKGYVLIYEGKLYRINNKPVLPHVGEGKSYQQTMIKRTMFRRYDLDRLVFVQAGLRENLTVEFWLVPAGAEPPKATPTLKKIKYRKGKPSDFCGEF